MLPEIETAGYLPIRPERGVLRVLWVIAGLVDAVVHIEEEERRAPGVGVEELHGGGDAVRALVRTSCVERTEVVEYLQTGFDSRRCHRVAQGAYKRKNSLHGIGFVTKSAAKVI